MVENSVPTEANVIYSHVIFKVKTNDYGRLKLTGRIFVHGNRDVENDMIRSDSAAADMIIVRTVMSLACCEARIQSGYS